MNLRQAFFLGGVLSSSLAAGGCSSPAGKGSEARMIDEPRVDPGPDSPLVGTRWKLTELNGAPVQAAPEGREPHLVLQEDGRFSGAGGVNLVLGAYKVEGENLTLGPGPSTRMAGPPEAMAREGAFMDAMKQVTSYRISGSSLTLGDANGPVLRFEAAAPR